jgi:hypothetical protein
MRNEQADHRHSTISIHMPPALSGTEVIERLPQHTDPVPRERIDISPILQQNFHLPNVVRQCSVNWPI